MPQTKNKHAQQHQQQRSDSILYPTSNPISIFDLPSHSATPAFDSSNDVIDAASGSNYLSHQYDEPEQEQTERETETVLVGRPSPSSNPNPHPSLIPHHLNSHPQVPSIWQSTSTSVNRLDHIQPHPSQFDSQSSIQYHQHQPQLPAAYLSDLPIPIHQQSLPIQSQSRPHHLSPNHQQSLPIPQSPPTSSAHPNPPLLATSNSGLLPPTYDAHNFNSNPPQLSNQEEASGGGGRFPRWTGWLEKRALERHYNRLDSNAVSRELGLDDPLKSNEELEIKYDLNGKPVLNEEMAKRLAKKKSWGKNRDDGDAISDEEEKLERQNRERRSKDEDRPPSPLPALPPLHSHTFGSRFLPHLPSQPLCAVYLDLPPSAPLTTPKSPTTQNGMVNTGGFRRNGVALQTQGGNWGLRRKKEADQVQSRAIPKPKIPPPRRVLLIGTAEGIFACEMRKEMPAEFGEELQDVGSSSHDQFNKGKSKEPEAGKWNGGIKVVQIWSGLGIYQLSVLSSSSSSDSSRPTSPLPFFQSSQPNPLPAGILLALTAPVPKPSSTSRVPLNRLSGMASALEHLASSSSHGHHQRPQSSHSSTSHVRESSHSHSHPKESFELPTAKFGSGAGGGSNSAVPPSGTGSIKMWSLEALRKLATLALDGDLSEPLDLVNSESSKRASPESQSAKSKISSKLKRAWITLGDNLNDRAARKETSDSSQSSSLGTVDPLLTQSISRGSLPRQFSSAVAEDLLEDGSARPSHSRSASTPTLEIMNDDLRLYKDGFLISPSINPMQEVRSRAMKLALSSVAINSSPGGSSSSSSIPLSGSEGTNLGAGPSFSSLFSDDSLGGHSSQSTASAKHKSSKDSSGVLFYAVHEASSEEKGRGTWYLALATSKTIMLYEAQPPKKEDYSNGTGNSSNRSFRFLRELYAPFPPNAISFVTANTSEEPTPIASVTSSIVSSSSSISTTTLGGGGGTGGIGNAKLTVGTPSGPLLTKPAGSKHGKHVSGTSSAIGKGVLTPQYAGGSAAPLGWKGADLSLFVSFGKRAVMIRVSDSNVREIELMAPSQAMSLDPSLAPPSNSTSATSRDRPNSSVETLANPLQPQPSSKRPKSFDGIGERSVKSLWVGLSTIEARVNFRQKKGEEVEEELEGSRPSNLRTASGNVYRLAPTGAAWKHPKRSSAPITAKKPTQDSNRVTARPGDVRRDSSSTNKALPSVPAPLNLSFDADLDPNSLGQSRSSASGHGTGNGADVLDSDSSSEDFDLEEERVEDIRSLSLQDNASNQGSSPASAATSPSSSPPPPTRGGFMRYKGKKGGENGMDDIESIHTVSANLALLSKGLFTQIFPSPLPPDLTKPRPLGLLEWSEPPSAVTGLARVVGIERESSRGFTSTSNLRSSSGSNPTSTSKNPSQHPHQHSSSVILRISVTAIGFISSSSSPRVEMQRTTIRTQSILPFKLDSSYELEINPYPLATFSSTVSNKSKSKSQLSLESTLSNSIGNERGPNLDLGERTSLQKTQNIMELELDYLGGMLLSSPVNGSRSHPSLGNKHWRPEESAGDGGAFGWSYRGGEDYRIFFVGAEV